MKKIKIKKGKKELIQSACGNAGENDITLAEKHYDSGFNLHKKGRIDEAIIYYHKALHLNPSHAMAIYYLGTAFHEKNLIDKAVAYYKKALELNPNIIGAYYNLGTIFQERKLLDEAIGCYQRVIDINPCIVDPYYNMGLALQEQGRLEEALAAYDKAIQCNPSLTLARWAKCISQIPIVYSNQSEILIARERYRNELVLLRNSLPLQSQQEIETAYEAIGKQQPFFLAYQGMNDRELQGLYGDMVCKIMSSKYPQFSVRLPMPLTPDGEPLRIGIVSAFFYYHAIWKIPIKGWVENIDKQRFKLFGYYTGSKKDKETELARKCFSRFVAYTRSFEELCSIIRKDNLHILIYPEIGMDPTTLKLAALRLAPVQCASWGHPDTSGLPTIDYYLSSTLIEPPEGDEHYTEKLVRLPNLSFFYTPPARSHVDLSRDALGLRPDSVLYHCFQSLYKHLPQNDDVFPKIAKQAGNCQFLFVSYPNLSQLVERFRKRISQAFDRYNMNASDYVIILPPMQPDTYEALNRFADVYLDTIGWSGCNSVLEALACNLPVVTLPTRLMRGREAFAILNVMGVTETIASNSDDYAGIAGRLGADREWRMHVSRKIAEKKHLVYRDMTCIRGLEDFMESVVAKRLAG